MLVAPPNHLFVFQQPLTAVFPNVHAPSFAAFVVQLAQTIADGGEEPTGDDAHRDDVTALMVAAQGGHEAVVKVLVGKGADVRAKDEEGFTPLLNAVKASW